MLWPSSVQHLLWSACWCLLVLASAALKPEMLLQWDAAQQAQQPASPLRGWAALIESLLAELPLCSLRRWMR